MVLCWQTFFDPESRKLDSFRGSLYPVTKYLERGAFFPGIKILHFCTDKIINCPHNFISPAEFLNKPNDCVFLKQDHRYLRVFSIRSERIILTSPEKITIVSHISCLCVFRYPFLGQDMLSIHLPLDKTIQICEAQKGLGIIRLRQSCLVEQSPM